MAAALHLKEVIKMCPSFLLNRSGNSLSSFNGLFSNQFQQNVHVSLTRAKHEDTSSQSKSALQRYKVRNRLPMIKEKHLLTGPHTEKNCASLGCSNKDSCKECKPETSEDFCGKFERPKVKLDSTKEIADKLSSYMVKDGFMRNMENLDLFSETQLVQIFDCSHDDVESIIARYPFLKTTSTPVIEEKVDLLMSYDFPLSMIRNNPRPLVSTYEELNRRLQLFEAKSLLTDNLVKPMEDLYSYLAYDENRFNGVYENLCDKVDQLEKCTTSNYKHLSDVFKCSQDDIKSIIAKHPPLKTMSVSLLQEKVDLWLSYNLPLSLVRNNPRPLCQIPMQELSRILQLMEDKSLLMTENSVESQEDFYNNLENDNKRFDTYTKNVHDDPYGLGTDNSKSEQLAQIFDCSHDDVESIIARHPFLKTTSTPVIEEKVYLLMSYDFPLSMIRNNPRPLVSTYEELNRRLQLFEAKSLLGDNLAKSIEDLYSYLAYDEKKFDTVYEDLCVELDSLESCTTNSSQNLAEVFECSQKDVESIIARHPFLKTTSTPVIEEKVDLLMSYDFPLSMIRNNPRPLVSTYEELNRRLQLFEAKSLLSDNLAKSMEDLYSYLAYDEKKFDTVYEDLCVELDELESCTTNSSKNLAEVFECSQKDVESIIARHPFLKTTSTPIIEEKIYLLVSYDFPLSMIRNNPRPLVFTYEELNRRLQLLEAKSLLSDNLVKSMEDLYCYLAHDEKKFDTVYEDLCVQLDALESCTTTSSKNLAKLFECSQKDVESILEKHPPLKTLPLPSIEQKVKLLLSYKFPMALIRKNPRPLYKYSDSELTRRLELLKEKS
ncbi:uncharacterized protein LOC131936142 [Physella acuta]|uniref:uncharacterized protein LOC131936142 n=1 Tax=Physella acuta TaxID=109671 RepID=UPI0027DD0622|nr:uncharacterized protein LOC131936142 [Physella acuta]